MFSPNQNEKPLSLLKICARLILVIALFAAAANATAAQTGRSTYLDFTGDGKTDWTVARRSQARGEPYTLKILGNQTNSAPSQPFIRIFDFGLAEIDILIAGDYIGDRKADLTAYRSGQPSIFYTTQFPIGSGGIELEPAVRWGTQGDNAFAPGDYDGDGKLDYTVVRRNNDVLTWFILSSTTGAMRAVNFGSADSVRFSPIGGADFTGDGRDELIVVSSNVAAYRTYYVGDAATGALLFVRELRFGSFTNSINLQPADYTGDGKADFVAIRRDANPMIWRILDPATGTTTNTLWGYGLVNAGDRPDIPVRGDYDGDGKQDVAIYRFTDRTFYVLKSSDGGTIAQQLGDEGDYPFYNPFFIVLVNAEADDTARIR